MAAYNPNAAGILLFICIGIYTIFSPSFLDLIFWSVVGCVLWFSLDTAVANHDRAVEEDKRHTEMESIGGR